MKKLMFIISMFVSFCAWASDPAIDFVDHLADQILTEVVTADKSKEEKERLFREAFVEAVDLKGVGQLVLSTFWKKASEKEREDFLQAFTDLTVKTWAARFDAYAGQQIVFQGSRNAERGQLYVDSIIQDKTPVEVTWRLRPSKDTYKIVDIRVEGVSMVSTYRNDYRSFLQQNGNSISKLIEELKRKTTEIGAEEKID